MIVEVPEGQWTLITTTTTDTVFQCRSLRQTYLRTGSATASLTDGFWLNSTPIVISAGTPVYASALDGVGSILFMEV